MNPVTQVFDCQHLRHKILTDYVRLKYNDELKDQMYEMITEMIQKSWYKYCSCELCNSHRQYSIATYGELI